MENKKGNEKARARGVIHPTIWKNLQKSQNLTKKQNEILEFRRKNK